jgi:photosystem II stability/assembly factor-like uncharacterized protein
VFVAAAGNPWAYTGERGVFKTIDGGKTWIKLTNGLPNDGKTGAINMVMDQKNPDILYVGFWQRLRRAYRFESGGPNGGIFKTTDGGKTWKKLTKGLPTGDTGRIGVAVSQSNPKVVMAFVEHGFQPTRNSPDYNDMTKLGTGVYRSEDGGETWQYMNRYNNRPFYYSHIFINPFDDKLVYLLTGSFQYSADGGKTLQSFRGRGIHSDYHAIWLDPTNKNRFYVGNDGGAYLTHDHGNNFIMFDNFVVSQFYMLAVDMRDPYYVYGGLQDNGTWGGPSKTRDGAIYTDWWYTISGGDGFHVQVDPEDWRTVYSEPHPGDRGGTIQRINVDTRESVSLRPTKGRNIVNYDEYITPEIEKMQLDKGWGSWEEGGMGAFRYNWSTPILLSPHNHTTIYYGANHLLKSVDRGDHWYIISPDLSKNDPDHTRKESGGLTRDSEPGGGAEFFGTIVTISESPLREGLIWVGTDDGNIQITRNGGKTWTNVRSSIRGVPDSLYISRVETSHFNEGTCYVTIDGHESSNFRPWVFKTTDYGRTWTNISNNIPDGQPVYVIREDLKNPNLLFIGTEFGIYFSIDDGKSWTKLNKNMPTVAVQDIVIHPRDNDLIAGTHGRGIWIMDDITPLQQLTPEILASEAYLFKNRPATKWLRISTGGGGGSLYYRGENPQSGSAYIHYYLGQQATGPIQIEISDITGNLKRLYTVQTQPGVGRLVWDMRFDITPEQRQIQPSPGGRGGGVMGVQASPGEYAVRMLVNGKVYTSSIIIRNDPLAAGGK